MVLSLAFVWLALRSGLRMRQGRDRAALRRRHLRVAPAAVAMVSVGALGGLGSAWWLRDWTPLQTFHSWAGVSCVLAFWLVGYAGRRLERGGEAARPMHGRIALLAVLLAALCAVSGFVLLP